MSRFLRPGWVVPSGDRVWLIDETWPVAVVFGAAGSSEVAAWPWPADGRPSADRVELGDGEGIVVQRGRELNWIDIDGHLGQELEDGLTLAAAEPGTAWLVDHGWVDPGRPELDPPIPPAPLNPGRIVALGRDGARREFAAPAPVRGIVLDGPELLVTLAAQPWTERMGRNGWNYHYPVREVRVARERLGLEALSSYSGPPHENPSRRRPGFPGWSWLRQNPEAVGGGTRCGQIIWWAGVSTSGRPNHPECVAVGYHADNREEALRVELGAGLIGPARAVQDELWLVVKRRPNRPVSAGRGTEVLALSETGTIRPVYRPDSIDISGHAPPVRPLEGDAIQRHVATVSGPFDGLAHRLRGSEGSTRELYEGLSDLDVRADGVWPDLRLILTFRHSRRPGLLLRRTFALFDDAGGPVFHSFADIHLMEDVVTGGMPPADEATDGILDL